MTQPQKEEVEEKLSAVHPAPQVVTAVLEQQPLQIETDKLETAVVAVEPQLLTVMPQEVLERVPLLRAVPAEVEDLVYGMEEAEEEPVTEHTVKAEMEFFMVRITVRMAVKEEAVTVDLLLITAEQEHHTEAEEEVEEHMEIPD